ncbi:unnamed protein product [Tilletia controversa]|nr:hypothetical protein CF328_g3447 [Tilletia controversa]CAD6897720.1 unnamed protein product [Tilletia controversa]CAD6901191.1 unnamed protein product [Tilletia controversa]CAD6926937.1 unnamed protein product [Tilletia controversa]CAD6967895.1 unnamed protein product [Tilletia controversa]
MARTRRQVIQAELVRREYCTEDDSVFAEFVDLMFGNKKTKEAIDVELSELIGPEYDPSFTDWLWRKAEALAAGIDDDEAPGGSAIAVPQPIPIASSFQAPSHSSSRLPEATGRTTAPPRAATAHIPARSPAEDERNRRIPPHMLAPRGFSRAADSFRPSRPEQNAQQSRPFAPRELFASAMNEARRGLEPTTGFKRTMAMRSPSPGPHQDDAMRSNKRAAMDDPSLGGTSVAIPHFERTPAKEVRIRGIGAIAAPAPPPAPAPAPLPVAIPTGPRNRGVQELFPGRGPAGVVPPQQRVSVNAARNTAHASAPAPSIFQRASVPDPRASSFVPQIFTPQHQSMQFMDVDMAPASPFRVEAKPHYNPLFFGGNTGATSTPLTEPPLAARLATMLPDNIFMDTTPTPTPVRANDISEFPTAPLDVSLCKWDLKCTNPMCRYSHATPCAANSDEASSALVLRQDACSFGPRCSKKDCVSSHPSPAVAIAYAKAGLLFNATHNNNNKNTNLPKPNANANGMAGSSGGSAPVWTITPGQVRCRWQAECKNATCPFQHSDGAGNLVPPPAQSAVPASNEGAAPTPTAPAPEKAHTTADGKPAALDRALDDSSFGGSGSNALSGKRCKWGADCRRADCMFGHPPFRRVPPGAGSSAFAAAPATSNNYLLAAGGSMPCRYGLSCFRADCFYSHPPGRKIGGGGGDGMANRMARFELPADTKMETIIPQGSTA